MVCVCVCVRACVCLLDVVAVHEHDVVPVGAVHVQVDLTDVGRQPSSSDL